MIFLISPFGSTTPSSLTRKIVALQHDCIAGCLVWCQHRTQRIDVNVHLSWHWLLAKHLGSLSGVWSGNKMSWDQNALNWGSVPSVKSAHDSNCHCPLYVIWYYCVVPAGANWRNVCSFGWYSPKHVGKTIIHKPASVKVNVIHRHCIQIMAMDSPCQNSRQSINM